MKELREKGFTAIFVDLLAVAVAYFSPILGILGVLLFAALADHFFGVWRAVKKKEKLSFWFGMLTSFTKFLQYGVIVTGVFLLEKYLLNEIIEQIFKFKAPFLISKITGLALFLLEYRSINKHYKEVKGSNLFSALFEGLGGVRKAVNEIGKIKSGITILIIALSLGLVGCKTAAEHFEAGFKKGGKIECKEKVITQTLKGVNGEDSVIFITVECPEIEKELTNREIKRLDKRERDSLKHVETLLRMRNAFIIDSLGKENKISKTTGKTKVKVEKQETKKKKEETKQVQAVESTKKKAEETKKKALFPWVLFFCWLILVTSPVSFWLITKIIKKKKEDG